MRLSCVCAKVNGRAFGLCAGVSGRAFKLCVQGERACVNGREEKQIHNGNSLGTHVGCWTKILRVGSSVEAEYSDVK